MARCRIYLFTYKRNQLFTRAVRSLVSQHFTDWICEVHNDCPGDKFPSAYIASLNDDRFIMKDHEKNLGAVSSFNLAFAGCSEAYASILEDDNWWEPNLLSELISVMENKPTISVAWCNMRLWQEEVDGNWKDTKACIWPDARSCLFHWPQVRQAMSALHSNGAMLFRGQRASNYLVPASISFNAVELIRERSFEHPIYFEEKPLANFAITLATARDAEAYIWVATQVMMLASFIASSPDKHKTIKETLAYHRKQRPLSTSTFFLANIFILKDPTIYKHFNLADWLQFSKWLIGNGHQLTAMKRYLTAQQETYHFLLSQTLLRYHQAEKNI
jgi:glycosyltransferase involved in cell wall biosynthesis